MTQLYRVTARTTGESSRKGWSANDKTVYHHGYSCNLRKQIMQFPKSWPSDCPPADAQDAQGEHFRVASNNPPSADDFKSYAELGAAPTAKPCRRVGLSLLRTLDDAIHQTKLFPKHGNMIFRGELDSSHGKTLLTKGTLPTHTTWWPFEGIDRAAPFVFAGAQ